MAWLLDMSRKEKEEYVIRLYKENKSIREIAKLRHMSFPDIGAIINKWKEETERKKGKLEGVYEYNVKSNSKITKDYSIVFRR